MGQVSMISPEVFPLLTNVHVNHGHVNLIANKTYYL